jgi:hypothetical protein
MVDRLALAVPVQPEDVREVGVIDRIEELHSAVLRAEADQRFGSWGRRAALRTEAEAAERAFLDQHGFASYNDFRLRIRRSTVAPAPLSARPVSDQAPAPDQDDVDLSPPSGDEPPAVISRAPRAGGVAADNELGRRVGPVVAGLRGEVERMMTLQIEQVELRAAQILSRATDEANDIVERARWRYDAMTTLLENAVRRSEHLVAVIDGLPDLIGSAREEAADVLRAFQDLTAD